MSNKFETNDFGHIINVFKKDVPANIKGKFWQDLERITHYDCETTSLDVSDPDTFRIVQLAASVYKCPVQGLEEPHEPEEFKCWFIRPGVPIEPGAMRVHGIYDSTVDDPEVYEEHGQMDVKDEPTFEEVGEEIREFLNKADVWCAYNGLGFDNQAINSEFRRCKIPELLKPTIDPFIWFLKYKGTIGRKKRGTKLSDAGRAFGASALSTMRNEGGKLHDARSDIQLSNDVLWKMARVMPQNCEELFERQAYLALEHETEINS